MGGKQYDDTIDSYKHVCEFPWLIQRLLPAREGKPGTGIDAYFNLDYMGAAEFEWGALPGSLKLMRPADKKEKWEPIRITVMSPNDTGSPDDVVCWYVGSKETLPIAEKFFADQLQRDYEWSLKERTEIRRTYFPENEWDGKFVGWWAVDGGPVPWAIFRTKEHAKNWLKGMRSK